MIVEINNLINSPGFGVILGAAISILTTYLANRFTSKDKREQKSLEISYSLRVQQLNLLIELQEVLQEFGRLNAQCHWSLMKDNLFAENGNRLCDSELDEKCRLARAKVIQINSQIQSDFIREEVTTVIQIESWSNDLGVIENCLLESAVKLNSVIESIGSEIRSTQDSLSKIFSSSAKQE